MDQDKPKEPNATPEQLAEHEKEVRKAHLEYYKGQEIPIPKELTDES
jgi:hypothetical protein